MKHILNYLTKTEQTITFAESMTGGRLAYELVKFPGASKVFKQGYILYSDEAKVSTLNMEQSFIDTHGVVSKEVAAKMATELHKLTGANFSVAITGYASGKDENNAYIAIVNDDLLYTDEIVFYLENSRDQNIKLTVRKVVKMLHEIIQSKVAI